MQLTILGSGTAIPQARHSPAGIVVRVAGESLLFDAGPGTLQRLHAHGVSYRDVDRVFLTHYHVDHCLDVVSLLFAARIPQPARRAPLVVYGPRGLKQLYQRLNRAFQGWLEPKHYRLTLTELSETTLRVGGYTIRTRRMQHSTPALGYRLEVGGRSIAYSGDTDICTRIVRLGEEADVLVLECSMPESRKVSGHLTPTECGRIAYAANCRHLILTHFYPVFSGIDIRARVRRSFQGRLTLARDGLTLAL